MGGVSTKGEGPEKNSPRIRFHSEAIFTRSSFIILIGVEVEFLPIGFIVSFGGEMFLLSDVIISFVLLYYLLQKL